jgi:hypothetical protein
MKKKELSERSFEEIQSKDILFKVNQHHIRYEFSMKYTIELNWYGSAFLDNRVDI